MSFATYKKSRTDLTKLNKKVEEISEGTRKSFKDSRFWKATVQKDGSGGARLRFIPAPEGESEDMPFVQYHEHNFDVDGSYFIELCPTTLGRECPVCKANSVLWKTGIPENQDIVKKRKRKLVYVSNIYVIKDKDAPENEGKVFLYQYGQKIYEKIKAALKPKDEEDPAVNVFDFWDGADFSLEIKQVAGYRNYDDSKFRAPSPLLKGDDKELEAIFKQCYPLAPFKAETKCKTYEELEKKFNDVVNGVKGKIQKKADELFPDNKPAEAKPVEKKTRKSKTEKEDTPPWNEPSKKSKKQPETESEEQEVPVDGDPDLNYYEKLGQED